jgi:hypothetical protein
MRDHLLLARKAQESELEQDALDDAARPLKAEG